MDRSRKKAQETGSALERLFARVRKSVVDDMKGMAAAAAGTLLLSSFAAYAKSAFDYAASLNELAQQTGTTAEQYQILARAAKGAGAEQATLDAALKRLNASLGEAQAGSVTAIKMFRQLGISKQQLDSFKQGGDALPYVMEGLKQVGNAATQAAAAKQLFGKASGELLPLLTQGAAGYEIMAAQAREAGIVTDESARAADEAADKIADLGETLKVNLANGLIAVIPLIESVVKGLAGIGSYAIWAMNQIARLPGATGNSGGSSGNFAGNVLKAIGNSQPGMKGAVALAYGLTQKSDLEKAAGVFGSVGNAALDLVRPKAVKIDTPDFDLSPDGKGGRKAKKGSGKSAEQLAAEAERARKEALRAEYEFQSDKRRNQIDILRGERDLLADIEDRHEVGQRIIDLELEQERDAAKLAVDLGEMTDEQAKELLAQRVAVADLERRASAREMVAQGDEERLRLDNLELELQQDMLRGEADAARTAAERRDIELKLLDLAYRQEKARLEAVLADETAGWAAQEEARRRLAGLDQRHDQDKRSVTRGTMGPLEAYMDSLPRSAADMNEAMERVAVDGIQSVTDGLAEATAAVLKLGGTFGKIANQIIADLLRIALQKAALAAIDLIGSAAGGGSGGGSGGFSTAPGRAIGGPVAARGLYLVGERGPELLKMGGQAGTIIPNHKMGQAVRTPRGGGSGSGMVIHVDARGAAPGVERQILAAIQAATPHIQAGTIQYLQKKRRQAL